MMVTWTWLSMIPAAIAYRVRPAVSWRSSLLMRCCRCFSTLFDADAKFRRDLFVGFAFGNQLQPLHFARTQGSFFLLEHSAPIWRLQRKTV